VKDALSNITHGAVTLAICAGMVWLHSKIPWLVYGIGGVGLCWAIGMAVRKLP
jgi:hypothetical protein